MHLTLQFNSTEPYISFPCILHFKNYSIHCFHFLNPKKNFRLKNCLTLINLTLKISIYTEKKKVSAPLIVLLQSHRTGTKATSKYAMKYSQASTIFQPLSPQFRKLKCHYQATLNQHLQFLVNRTFVLRSI